MITVRDPLCAYDEDPAKKIADRLENAELIGNSGMFTTYSGTYKGARITVVSGGSGSPEMELILYDFMEYTDASTFLRVGGSGGLGDQVHPGDVVIASGVVREEGMTKAYIPAAYPAASHYEVILSLIHISLGFLAMNGSYGSNMSILMASAVILIAPIVIFFLCAQKYFVDGMVSGAVKG